MSKWTLDTSDPACLEIVERAKKLGITGNPDEAAHALGTITLADGRTVNAHVVHAVDPIITDDNEVVMINRKHDPGQGKPALPGGFLDPTKDGGVETAVQAAAREAMEEVGITLGKGTLIGTRNVDRPYDVRIAQNDMPLYGIKKDDIFIVSTQAVRFDVPDLAQTKLVAGDDAAPGSARRVRIDSLTKDAVGIPDHFAMIAAACHKQRLSPQEQVAVRNMRALAKEQGGYPVELVVITDAGRDHDDELALTVLRGLDRLGLVKLKAAVVNLSADDRRARLVKGSLTSLGFADLVPVAIGSNDKPAYEPKPYEFDASYIAPSGAVEADGQALLKRTFEEAAARGKKLSLVLISGMTDARNFIRANPALAQQALAKVSIMGGVETEGNELTLDGDGRFLPDSAYNNTVDKYLNKDPKTDSIGPSAKEVYAKLQEWHIPTKIVTRNSAYAAAVSPDFYKELASSGHPVGQRLWRDQRMAIENLWEEIQTNAPDARNNKNWFYEKFSYDPAQAKEDLQADPTNPWKVVDKLQLYDPITVIAAVAPDKLGLFVPDPVGQHLIFGTSERKSGIADSDAMRTTLSALAKLGLGATLD